jgi:hypothetical protein
MRGIHGILELVALLSRVLFVTTTVLWARSYRAVKVLTDADRVNFRRAPPAERWYNVR